MGASVGFKIIDGRGEEVKAGAKRTSLRSPEDNVHRILRTRTAESNECRADVERISRHLLAPPNGA
jgi:hypothetical protein